jgi:hypothetical protein
MHVRFGTEVENIAQKYTEIGDPTNHIAQCRNRWSSTSKEEWTHKFIHTLDTISKNWYLELEMHRETTNWDELTQRFKVTFMFEHKSPLVDAALQVIRTNIFSEKEPVEVVPVFSTHRASMTVHELLECYNVSKEHDEEDPRNV